MLYEVVCDKELKSATDSVKHRLSYRTKNQIELLHKFASVQNGIIIYSIFCAFASCIVHKAINPGVFPSCRKPRNNYSAVTKELISSIVRGVIVRFQLARKFITAPYLHHEKPNDFYENSWPCISFIIKSPNN